LSLVRSARRSSPAAAFFDQGLSSDPAFSFPPLSCDAVLQEAKMRFRFAGESNSAQTSPWIGRSYHYRNVTGTGFAVCEGRHVKMPDHHRRMAIALMTRWFEHVQVGGAFNHTIFVIFSEDSPFGRFADGEMISFDEVMSWQTEITG
jgi:hypothetical protein